MLEAGSRADLPSHKENTAYKDMPDVEDLKVSLTYHPFTREEECDLILHAQNGDEFAINKLLDANMGFMKQYARKFCGRGVDRKDLMQESQIALLKAIEKFDVEKGNWLLTYAIWWMRQSLGRAVANGGRTIRVPIHVIHAYNRKVRAIGVLNDKGVEDPSLEQLSKITGDSPEAVERAEKAANRTVSLDKAMPGRENGESYKDNIKDEDSTGIEQILHSKKIRTIVRRAMGKLNPREEQVLRLRYGMDGYKKELSLQEVGKIWGLTRERIRQIQVKAETNLKRQILVELKKDRAVCGKEANMIEV